jgi:hypothetical protein
VGRDQLGERGLIPLARPFDQVMLGGRAAVHRAVIPPRVLGLVFVERKRA